MLAITVVAIETFFELQFVCVIRRSRVIGSLRNGYLR